MPSARSAPLPMAPVTSPGRRGPAVDAHAHRHAQPRAGAGDGAHAVVVPDVAGVDADFRDSGFGRVNRELIIEMDVRHQRQRRML